LRSKASALSGFDRKLVAGPSSATLTLALPIYPEMYNTFSPGFRDRNSAASSRPFMRGNTISVINNSIRPL